MECKIDARGKICPVPVVMAKKEAENGIQQFSMLVDNRTAVENLKRFAASNGYMMVITETGPDFDLAFTKSGEALLKTPTPLAAKRWAVLAEKETLGEGSAELGEVLLKMFFYTLTQDENAPAYVLFLNAGVKIPVFNEQAAAHLATLEEMGTQVLVCGTCLQYYGIAENLRAGTVSNMYDIVDAMKLVDKVITI